MPSTIPAAMASAISGPRLVKTPSFFSLSGMLVDRTGRRTCMDLVSLPRSRGSQSRPLGSFDPSQGDVHVSVSTVRCNLN